MNSRHISNYGSKKRRFMESCVGICLECNERLTFCGAPFTLNVMCPKCRVINVYIDSQQPTRTLNAD